MEETDPKDDNGNAGSPGASTPMRRDRIEQREAEATIVGWHCELGYSPIICGVIVIIVALVMPQVFAALHIGHTARHLSPSITTNARTTD